MVSTIARPTKPVNVGQHIMKATQALALFSRDGGISYSKSHSPMKMSVREFREQTLTLFNDSADIACAEIKKIRLI